MINIMLNHLYKVNGLKDETLLGKMDINLEYQD